ncbi:hypothetical protein [Delftia acidovorans]|uniref:Uncharacterized protein n=1 Tax=Delftia acidovorans TaxID=80866 RepID=A0AAJ2R9U7_DELAC|nr:hypothetical protein [Delftia acidovorans]MDX4957873.1 hypothetical protein [Delftia acidovorans]
MSEAIKPAMGEWHAEGNCFYTLQHAGWRRGEEQFENRLFGHVQPGRNSSLAEANPIASLFAEAGTVHHETGMTPRQLVEQRDALAKVVANVVAYFDAPGDGCFSDTQLEQARAALALAKGTKP